MSSRLYFAFKIILLISAYFAAARLGLSLDAKSGFAALVWAPSGIALAAILLFGNSLWPGIWIGAYIANLYISGAPLWVAAGIATGNTLEALTAKYVLKRITGFRESLDRQRDVLALILFASVFATAISATVGVFCIWLSDLLSPENAVFTWLAWWIGDMLGILVITPFILIWSHFRQIDLTPRKTLELIFALIVLYLISTFVFRGLVGIQIQTAPISYIVFPVLIWASLRFGQLGATTGILLLSVIAISNTASGHGPFVTSTLSDSLFLLQSFLGITSITFLTLAASIEEQTLTEKRKDDFIRIASHELRTPIASIKGFLEILLSNRLSKKSGYILNKMNSQVDRLISLINGLLDVASIKTGQLEYRKEKLNMDELIKDIARVSQTTYPEHTIIVQPKAGSFVYADRNRLTQVLGNLISNAIKFSPKKSKIIIQSKSIKDQVEVSIKDFGIGISKTHQSMLFEPFFQVENRNRKSYSGLGMGLHLSSEMLKGQNGRMWIQSQPGKGSVFTIRLPRYD